MGNSIAQSFRNRFCKVAHKIVMLGEESSGRTTALYKLKLNQIVNSIPTVGFNVENIQLREGVLQVWDIGGSCKLRDLWTHYYEMAEGVAFFVDLSRNDEAYYRQNRMLLEKVLESTKISQIPILFVCNKKDIAVITHEEAMNYLGPHMLEGRTVRTISACALTGQGLLEGLEWINNEIERRK